MSVPGMESIDVEARPRPRRAMTACPPDVARSGCEARKLHISQSQLHWPTATSARSIRVRGSEA